MENTQNKNLATYVIIAINVIVWVILMLMGNTQSVEFMYNHGAMSAYGALVEHEYWRFFTSNFLHFTPEHLLNNMLLLAVAGSYVEPELGHIKFSVVYVLSGILGSVCSCIYMVYKASYSVSAGASGAIFGVVGALLYLILVHKGKFSGIKLKGMLLSVFLMLFVGITSQGVDNAAHIGGFVIGFIVALVTGIRRKQRED